MRETVRDKGRLEHMLRAIDNALEYTQGLTCEYFEENKILCHATIYNIQIIGEAVYKLTKEFKETHNEVEWRVIEGLRHVLVHDYYQVNYKEVWNVIQDDLPILRQQITEYLNDPQGW